MIRLVFLIALAFTAACSRQASSDVTPDALAASAEPAVAVATAVVESAEIARVVEAVGTLDPNEEVSATNQVEGTVERVLVDLGDAVRQGQVLAELDTRELELNVSQQAAALQQELARLGMTDEASVVDDDSTAQVRQAEANFQEAKVRLERLRKLSEQGVVPPQQYDEQRARYEVAEASVKSARETVRNIRATIAARKAALSLSQKKLSDARIVSPLSGYVRDRVASPGQFLRANSPVVTIVQTSPLKLRADVPESATASVKIGQSVRFTVDAYPGADFEGRVYRISPAVNQQSRTLQLEILVPNPGGRLKPGFFARVSIQSDRKDKILVIPADAVVRAAGIEKVFLVENGKITDRVVRTGVRVGERVEIVDGLNEGQVVAVSNLGGLQQGREVTTK